jgi:hypothetical protein
MRTKFFRFGILAFALVAVASLSAFYPKSDSKNGALTSKRSLKVTGQQTKLLISPNTASFKDTARLGLPSLGLADINH